MTMYTDEILFNIVKYNALIIPTIMSQSTI